MEFDIERMMLRLIGRVEELEERIKSLEKQLNLQSDCSDSNSDEMPSEIKTNADIRKAVYLLSIQEKITEKDVEQLKMAILAIGILLFISVERSILFAHNGIRITGIIFHSGYRKN